MFRDALLAHVLLCSGRVPRNREDVSAKTTRPLANQDTFQPYADNGVDLLKVSPSNPQ